MVWNNEFSTGQHMMGGGFIKNRIGWFFQLLLFLIVINMQALALRLKVHVYITWNNLEVDKCATAWLIKRFVDPLASFQFCKEGTIISGGIPFDTPDSDIRRTFNKTAFDVVIDKNGISDSILKSISLIIRDVELNTWGRKRYKLSEIIDSEIIRIIGETSGPEEALNASIEYFDDLYIRIQKNPKLLKAD